MASFFRLRMAFLKETYLKKISFLTVPQVVENYLKKENIIFTSTERDYVEEYLKIPDLSAARVSKKKAFSEFLIICQQYHQLSGYIQPLRNFLQNQLNQNEEFFAPLVKEFLQKESLVDWLVLVKEESLQSLILKRDSSVLYKEIVKQLSEISRHLKTLKSLEDGMYPADAKTLFKLVKVIFEEPFGAEALNNVTEKTSEVSYADALPKNSL